MRTLIVFLAEGLGSGRTRYAPGTFGTLAGVVIFYFLLAPLHLYWQIAIVAFSGVFGIWLTASASRFLSNEDPSSVVWDEWVGVWICLILLPINWFWYLIAFALFRLLDIWKPLFIGYLDKNLHGGWGIMLDDIAAGFVALAILQTSLYLINGL